MHAHLTARTGLRLTVAASAAAALLVLAACGSNDPGGMSGMDHGSNAPTSAAPADSRSARLSP